MVGAKDKGKRAGRGRERKGREKGEGTLVCSREKKRRNEEERSGEREGKG